ncbi:MAG: hypothetical protein M1818_007979 [Claussenomyces sp. TS43310]|nr:MAG: hypothetical protein M1818_007979 [Claussenomyces sp. TS43310]
MEAAPLTLAHHHARAASKATNTSDTAIAISEHALAAGEFAKAATGKSSEEAMRTLKLLEQHHQRLSELLKLPTDNAIKPSDDGDVVTTQEENVKTSPAVSELQNPHNDMTRSASPRRSNPAASGIRVPRRMPPRDVSSSIASNLASARGIRSSHERRAVSPSVTTHQAPGNLEVHPRRAPHDSGIPAPLVGRSNVPASGSGTQTETKVTRTPASVTPVQSKPSAAEEGFQKFYSTFESFLSRISAPLAFAGLPLISEEAHVTRTEEESKHKRNISAHSATAELDLDKFISKAALRASSNPAPGADSFYVVPTTGHTVSYANILSFAEKEKRRLAASMHTADPDLFEDPDNDDFVDAKETLVPSPMASQRSGRRIKGLKEMDNVVEELQTENKSLKECIDQLTRRLQAFESAAQSSSLAMQESMRMMKPSSPTIKPTDASDANAKLLSRLGDLEEQIQADQKDMQKLGKENDKLRSIVSRYRERWEKLKEGAKTRREGGSKDPPGGSS